MPCNGNLRRTSRAVFAWSNGSHRSPFSYSKLQTAHFPDFEREIVAKNGVVVDRQRNKVGSCLGFLGCATWGPGSIILTMQEVLSKANDPKALPSEQELYELSLLDEANDLGIRYIVRQWHAEWIEIDRQVMWDQEEAEYFWIQAEAKQRYAERRLALTERRFIYSDMDLF